MLKNITLSADATLIEKAREAARKRHTTLNEEFRGWLARYVRQGEAGASYRALMERLEYIDVGGTFTRNEMNER